MYKFFGTPLKEVTSRQSGKVIFRFDTKGEFITDDPAIIDRATGFFDHIEMKAETVGERVAKTFLPPPMTITNNLDNENSSEPPAASGKLQCKKCDFTCENQGELMRHHKTEHPKTKEE